ncbi:MAG: neutral zinc metallopeptidase [Gemmataceae bacterium]
MQWEGREESENVEDRRAFGGRTIAIGGGGIILLLLGLFLGVNPDRLAELFGRKQGAQPGPAPTAPADPQEERLAKFAKVVFHDTEVVWDDLFQKIGKTYVKPTLVLFRGQVNSACGTESAAVGPFYCPGDRKVYIDLSFYNEMERRLGAPGEFARAYVLGHEVGHHVQNLLGYSAAAREKRGILRSETANQVSVRQELQADFLAGVWAYHAEKRFRFLEKGDIDSAINAAYKIGDDFLQKRARGYVMPDAFTHGRSDQRVRWFRDGFETGDLSRAELLFTLPYKDL